VLVVSARGAQPDVLMITNMWPHAENPAYGIFVKRQVESLQAAGLDCEVRLIAGYRSRWAYAREAVRMFARNFSRRRPRVVHGHGGETALVARLYLRAPVIVSYCGDDLLGTPRADGSLTRASRVRRAVLRHHARLLTATVTKSREMERALPARARRRNEVIPNGVDRALFRPLAGEGARAELGWSPSERIALFAADPRVERKRFPLAEQAGRAAESEVGPIRLHVSWGTPPAQMPRLMAAADCLLLTSAIEGSPNVVKEAVSCGLPVVSTPVGDVAEILRDVEPSWVCPAEPGALGSALAQCLAGRRRSNGWERTAWLGQEQIARRLLELYQTHAAALDGIRSVGECAA